MSKKLQISLAGTGTPYGFSYWMRWLGCERAAWLAMGQKLKFGLSGRPAMDRGTVGHALLAAYYSGANIDTANVEFIHTGDVSPNYLAKVTQSAIEMFLDYRAEHPAPREFGKPLAVESDYTIKDAFGGLLHTYTFAPDLEVRLTPARARAVVPYTFSLDGIYLVDHKFRERIRSDDDLVAQESLRYHMYNMAYAELYPKQADKLRGTIVNIIYNTRSTRNPVSTMKRVLVRYPPPKPIIRRIQRTLERVRAVEQIARSHQTAAKVNTRPDCYTWRGECSWYRSKCPGY